MQKAIAVLILFACGALAFTVTAVPIALLGEPRALWAAAPMALMLTAVAVKIALKPSN